MAWGILFVMLVALITGRKALLPVLTVLFAVAVVAASFFMPITEAKCDLLFCTETAIPLVLTLLGGMSLLLLPPLTLTGVWQILNPSSRGAMSKSGFGVHILGVAVGLTAIVLFASAAISAHRCAACRVESKVPFGPRTQPAAAVLGDHLVVTGGGNAQGYGSDVWETSDGRSWDRTANAVFPGRQGHVMTAFNNKLWLLAGWDGTYRNDLWWSEDGKNWIAGGTAPFSPRCDMAAATDGKRMWVIGGMTADGPQGDVWTTSDGKRWSRLRGKAPFDARRGHTAAYFEGKLWVLGGVNGRNEELSDAWFSTDGKEWVKATAPPFKARVGLAAVVHDRKLWVVGGTSVGALKLNPWWTADGVTWHESTSGLRGPSSSEAAAASFDGRLWILPGAEGRMYSADL